MRRLYQFVIASDRRARGNPAATGLDCFATLAMTRKGHYIARTMKRATQRPAQFAKPAHWTSEPPPAPKPGKVDEDLSPTRYGDWVHKGIAIDF
ncbi:conserved hypothetical protein [Erythrobacter sp. EC-HK427]|nr:conserved hypothetical protein [Erythrobacter sp. EC-HK427]